MDRKSPYASVFRQVTTWSSWSSWMSSSPSKSARARASYRPTTPAGGSASRASNCRHPSPPPRAYSRGLALAMLGAPALYTDGQQPSVRLDGYSLYGALAILLVFRALPNQQHSYLHL